MTGFRAIQHIRAIRHRSCAERPAAMTEKQAPIDGSFMGIKQTLDPAASYMIFENDPALGGDSLFDTAHTAYAWFDREGYDWQQVWDPDLNREYLVVRIEKGNEDQVLGRAMGYGFPGNTVFYLFKAREAGE